MKLERWRADSTLGAGLRSKDVLLDSAEVFAGAAGDIPVAESADGGMREPSRPSQAGFDYTLHAPRPGDDPLRPGWEGMGE